MTHFENSIVKTWRQENVIVFGTSPKVGSAHEAGDVENHDALQRREWNGLAVTFDNDAFFQVLVRSVVQF